jgi:hypothetical protein
MKTLPFNLEAALRGEPVVTRDGRSVTGIIDSKDGSMYPVESVDSYESWTHRGVMYVNGKDNPGDLFMLDTSGDVSVTATVDPRRGEWAARFMVTFLQGAIEDRTFTAQARYAIEAADELIRQLDA